MTDIPYGNLTALNHDIVHGWETSALKRGTSDILYSCLVTITLCIYTSIHLNVPDPQETSRQKYLRLAKWVGVGIFAPEWVIYAAWRQWKDARVLLKDIKEHTESEENSKLDGIELNSVVVTANDETTLSHDEGSQPDSNNRKEASSQYNPLPRTERHIKKGHVADMTYAFYVLMGGIRVDVSDISDQLQSVCLKRKGLIDIIKNDGYYHVQLDKKLIDDHSKANYLAKLLVCCQVTWMATQCIARKASGLPLTLLELHTFAHVFCALLIYIFWFRKPLSVNEASVIKLPDKFRHNIARAMCLHHEKAVWIDLQYQHLTLTRGDSMCFHEKSIIQAKHDTPLPGETCRDTIFGSLEKCKNFCQSYSHLSRFSQFSELRHKGYQLSTPLHHKSCTHIDPCIQTETLECDSDNSVCMLKLSYPSEQDYIWIMVSLTDADKLRWRLAAGPEAFSNTYSDMFSHSRQTTYPSAIRDEESLLGNLVNLILEDPLLEELIDLGATRPSKLTGQNPVLTGQLRANHLYTPGLSSRQFRGARGADQGSIKSLNAGSAILLMPCVYGAIHLCAWNWAFPSKAETWMWRVSALCVASAIPAFKLTMMLDILVRLLGTRKTKRFWDDLLLNVVTLSILALLVCTFTLSRLLLVLEVFLSLRAVPIGVYASIPWTQYIPHL